MPKVVQLFFFLFMFPGETCGRARQVPPVFSAFQKAAESSVFPHDVQNEKQRQYPHRDEDGLLSFSLFSFLSFFFVALLKGSFPTQFI